MKRANKMSRPNSRILLYFALCVILTFLMLGCGSSSGGSGSDATASNDTGSVAANLKFQDNFEETSEFQAAQNAGAEFDCDDNGVGWVEIHVLDENGETLATAGAECEVGEATCTGVKAGSNRKIIAYAKPNRNSDVVLYSGETTEPITVGEGETTSVEIILEKLDQPPVSNSGPDQNVDVGDTVTLDGSNSYDDDGNIVSYLWSQRSGPAVTLSSPTSAKTTFTAPSTTASLTFQLRVTDDDGLQATDTCIVNVGDIPPPVADAGPDQTVNEGDTVTLDGSNSEDPDGSIESYLWTQISGPAVTLSSPTSASTTFTAPAVGAGGASLTFQLRVTDDDGLQATDTCIVNVGDIPPPVADAGPDQTVNEGDTVTLDGSNSYDPDGFIRSYLWTQISGPTVTLSSTTVGKPTFTAPDVGAGGGASLTFQLRVTDDDGLQATDECIVNVGDIIQVPIADAGPDQNAKEGDSVTLDGSKSYDPDGSIASYLWNQISGPAVKLSSKTAVQPTFTAPTVGAGGASLTFQLWVKDNEGLKATDECIVNVGDIPPPIADAGPDQTVDEGASVTLDGSKSYDQDGSIAYYLWTQISGPFAPLSSTTVVKPTFTAPDVGAGGATLTFQLTVTDNDGLQATDECSVDVLDVISGNFKITKVDSGINLGYISIAAQTSDRIFISYYAPPDNPGWLRLGTNESGYWDSVLVGPAGDPDNLDNIMGLDSAIAHDSRGNVHIAYYDTRSSSLIYASYYDYQADGTEFVDFLSNFGGQNPRYSISIAVDSKNTPYIIYSSADGVVLSLAKRVSFETWDIFTVDNSCCDTKWYTSIALDSKDKAHISYYRGGRLRYATNATPTGELYLEGIDSSYPQTGLYTSIAVDRLDNVHISYNRNRGGDVNDGSIEEGELAYATGKSNAWTIEVLDDSGGGALYNSGISTSIAVDSSNKAHISYFTGGLVRYITNANASGEWEFRNVDSLGSLDALTAIALDSDENVHIGYIDFFDGLSLKHATLVP